MKIEVRYYTRTGNTKKLAEAIAEEAGVEALTTDSPIDSETDILFLGSSVYAAGVDEKIRKFIDSLSKDQVKKIVNFSTAAIIPSTYKQVRELAAKREIAVAEEEFHCRGSFGPLHKNRPNESDIQDVRTFARSILEK